MGIPTSASTNFDLDRYLSDFNFEGNVDLFSNGNATQVEDEDIEGITVRKYTNEFWTSGQRKASSIHEISYRACFKPQLPRFFIGLFSKKGEIVYDPFSGRGTTVIEAALMGRNIISNDINPLSEIIVKPRLFVPALRELDGRLSMIPIRDDLRAEIDLGMFYHADTLKEILSLREYLAERERSGELDDTDRWIRMVATNRLTGHSRGFFSVYTLPPNQALSPDRQIKINRVRNQAPDYRDTRKIILVKSKDLVKDLNEEQKAILQDVGKKALFISQDARNTREIKSDSVTLTVTSPPFLDVVQYDADNWLRCWFNRIDTGEIGKKITMARKLDDWNGVMEDVFGELHRITRPGGHVAFEVGEVRGGKIRLDEHVVRLGSRKGFLCEGIMINQQKFTKTANIWGVSNNGKGTNTNRIVVFCKEEP